MMNELYESLIWMKTPDADRITNLENYIKYLSHEVDKLVGEIKTLKK